MGNKGEVDTGFLDISNLLEIGGSPKEKEKEKEVTEIKEAKVVSEDEEVKAFEDGTFELVKKEETPEEHKEDKKDKTPSEVEDSSPSSPYLAFARYNAEEGVFDTFTDEEWKELVEGQGSEDAALFELNKRTIESEVTRQVESYKKTLSDEDRLIFESKVNGLPLDEIGLITYNKQRFLGIKEEDLENESIQEEAVRHNLQLKGNNDEDIKDTIDAFKETDKLKLKAKNAVAEVIKYYNNREKEIKLEVEKEQQEELKVYQQEVQKMKTYVETLDEVVPGLKLTKQTKDKLFNLMTTPAGADEDGTPVNAIMQVQRKNPVAFTAALHYYYDLGLFNIDDKGNFKPDFSKITGKIQTDVTKKTRKIFEDNTAFQGGAKTGAPRENVEDEERFSKAFKNVDKLWKG